MYLRLYGSHIPYGRSRAGSCRGEKEVWEPGGGRRRRRRRKRKKEKGNLASIQTLLHVLYPTTQALGTAENLFLLPS